MIEHLFFLYADETEDEEANKEYVEETNRDSIMIAASKLVATEAVPKVFFFFFLIIQVSCLFIYGKKV